MSNSLVKTKNNIDMNNTLDYAIENSLKFNTCLQPLSLNIPKLTSVFGVFVTVKRRIETRSLQSRTRTYNVHGCIGYWDKEYKILSKNKIINKIKSVSYSATWNDERAKYFKNPIFIDILATYEINFMLDKVMLVDENTGIISGTNILFNNEKYGLIVVNKQNLNITATYLPNVYPNKKWDYIKKHLSMKANSNLNNIFYAYETVIIEKSIADYFMEPVRDFINSSYGKFIPYMIDNNSVHIDKKEYVRNLATIYDIIILNNNGYHINKSVIKMIAQNTLYYIYHYRKHKNKMLHASIFLLLILSNKKNGVNPPKTISVLIDEIKTTIYAELDKMEYNFALGQALMALAIVDKNNKYAEQVLDDKLTKIMAFTENDVFDMNNIFRYNWHAKFIKEYKTNDCKTYAKILLNKIINVILTFDNIETNYLAVAFESLTALYGLLNDSDKENANPHIESLMIKLSEKKNCRNGLYMFKNGTMRLDITGHVLNGYFNLIDYVKSN